LGLKTGRKITEEEINETKREAEREIGSGYFHPLIPKSKTQKISIKKDISVLFKNLTSSSP